MDAEHDKHWRNFINAAELKIIELSNTLKKGEKIQWLVEKSSYVARAINDFDNERSKNEYIKQIQAIARRYPRVSLIFYEAKDEFANAVNTVDGAARQGSSCVSHFSFYGHGSPGHLWLNFTYGGINKETGESVDQMTLSNKDIKSGFLLKQAFTKGCKAESWACNTSSNCKDNQPSFGQVWHSHFGFGIQGARGQTHYGPCYKSRYPWRKPKPPILDPNTGIEIVTP